MESQSTIFVVSKKEEFRESAAALARKKGLRAQTFPSTQEFLSSKDVATKGCVIIGTPAGDGAADECLQALQQDPPIMPVIVTAEDAKLTNAVKVMQAGAVDFLEQPSDHELSGALDRALEIEEDRHRQRKSLVEMKHRRDSLTDDEREVFRRLLAGQANKRIASDLDIGLRTVELRRANIMRKMEADSMPDLVRMAIQLNILKL